MGFLAPMTGLLAAAIAVPALVLLYFLKLRRREMDVSSTLLWRKAIQDLQVNAPFQKLRRNLLLLLQLIILLALLFAVARPTLKGPAAQGKQVVILIDHSGSMNATDVSPTRLARAKELALQLVNNLGSAQLPGQVSGGSGQASEKVAGAMVLSFARQAQVVQPMTGDRGLLRAAIESIQPTDEVSRLTPALQLAEPFALSGDGSGPGKGVIVYVFSDGVVEDERELALRGAELRYVRIGQTDNVPDNVGIVSLAARRDPQDLQRVQVLANVMNYGTEPVDVNVSLALDGKVERVSKVTIQPETREDDRVLTFRSGGGARGASGSVGRGGDASVMPGRGESATAAAVQFDLQMPDAALVTVSLDRADKLMSDNRASLLIAPPQRMRVLLVSDRGNVFLERSIRATGVETLTRASGASYEATEPANLLRGAGGDPGAGFDLIVFDGFDPSKVPNLPSLYFGASPPIAGLRRHPGPPAGEDSSGPQPVLDWKRDDAILRYVALEDLLVQSPGRLALPDGATILATGQSGPVLAEVRQRNVRHVVTSFDLLQTNWPLRVSFAVFMNNVLQELGAGTSGEVGRSFVPGEVAVLPAKPGASRVKLTGPEVLEAPVESGQVTLPMFRQAGVYRAASGLAPPWDQIPVNVTNMVESELWPAVRLNIGSTSVQGQGESDLVEREIWRWFVLAALAVLMIEWLVYCRKMYL